MELSMEIKSAESLVVLLVDLLVVYEAAELAD